MFDFGKLLLFPLLFVVVFITSVRGLENAANDASNLSIGIGVYQYKYQGQIPVSLTEEGLTSRAIVTQNFLRSLTKDQFSGVNGLLLFIASSIFCFERLRFSGNYPELLFRIIGFPKYLLFRQILM